MRRSPTHAGPCGKKFRFFMNVCEKSSLTRYFIYTILELEDALTSLTDGLEWFLRHPVVGGGRVRVRTFGLGPLLFLLY